MDCCRYGFAVGSVFPITMARRQRGSPAPEVHHFRASITYSPPSRTMRASMFVASDEATSGSVMAKQERISPASSGSSQRSFCSSVP